MLLVDWVYGASFAYNLVVENYKEVAVQISVLINQLKVRDRLEKVTEHTIKIFIFYLNKEDGEKIQLVSLHG